MKIMLAVQVVGQLSFEPMLRRASVSAFLLTLITISGGRNYCINYFYIILGLSPLILFGILNFAHQNNNNDKKRNILVDIYLTV